MFTLAALARDHWPWLVRLTKFGNCLQWVQIAGKCKKCVIPGGDMEGFALAYKIIQHPLCNRQINSPPPHPPQLLNGYKKLRSWVSFAYNIVLIIEVWMMSRMTIIRKKIATPWWNLTKTGQNQFFRLIFIFQAGTQLWKLFLSASSCKINPRLRLPSWY